ncbi:MAG: ArsR/SmtB family transcription factor [Fusobacteriota bacterium]
MEEHFPRKEVLKKIKDEAINKKDLKKVSKFFSVLGNNTRIKILNAISVIEMCVCEISEFLDMEQSAVSHQLRVLRKADLVRARRDGKRFYYSLADKHVESILNQGLEHIREEKGD